MRAVVSKERPTAQNEAAFSEDEESYRPPHAIALLRKGGGVKNQGVTIKFPLPLDGFGREADEGQGWG